jgi:hypothetical protein
MGPRLHDLIKRTPFNLLLRHARRCWVPILTRIIKDPPFSRPLRHTRGWWKPIPTRILTGSIDGIRCRQGFLFTLASGLEKQQPGVSSSHNDQRLFRSWSFRFFLQDTDRQRQSWKVSISMLLNALTTVASSTYRILEMLLIFLSLYVHIKKADRFAYSSTPFKHWKSIFPSSNTRSGTETWGIGPFVDHNG